MRTNKVRLTLWESNMAGKYSNSMEVLWWRVKFPFAGTHHRVIWEEPKHPNYHQLPVFAIQGVRHGTFLDVILASFWHLLASFGIFWHLLASFGIFWHLLASFGYLVCLLKFWNVESLGFRGFSLQPWRHQPGHASFDQVHFIDTGLNVPGVFVVQAPTSETKGVSTVSLPKFEPIEKDLLPKIYKNIFQKYPKMIITRQLGSASKREIRSCLGLRPRWKPPVASLKSTSQLKVISWGVSKGLRSQTKDVFCTKRNNHMPRAQTWQPLNLEIPSGISHTVCWKILRLWFDDFALWTSMKYQISIKYL